MDIFRRSPEKTYKSVYKTLLKSEDIYLSLYSDRIEGKGYICEFDSNGIYKNFSYNYSMISAYNLEKYQKKDALIITIDFLFTKCKIILPGITQLDEINNKISDIQKKVNDERIAEEYNIQKTKQENEIRQKEIVEFYNDAYFEHIKKNDRPLYLFEKEVLLLSGMYIGEDKSINFLSIDGNQKRVFMV